MLFHVVIDDGATWAEADDRPDLPVFTRVSFRGEVGGETFGNALREMLERASVAVQLYDRLEREAAEARIASGAIVS